MIVRGSGEDKGSKELLIGIKQHVRQRSLPDTFV